ncbi:MAG: M23 family metallopeptidase [Bacillota bacterium]|nr:M23 family metallopeptidase [Bacillota bacterium]
MNDTMARGSYRYKNMNNKKKKRNKQDKSRFLKIVFRQFVISLLIFIAASGIRNINSPVTSFLDDKIKYALAQNVEINDIFNKINSLTDMIKNKANDYETQSKDSQSKNQQNQDTKNQDTKSKEDQAVPSYSNSNNAEDSSVPASAPLYDQNMDEGKIDYGGTIEDEINTNDSNTDNSNNTDETIKNSGESVEKDADKKDAPNENSKTENNTDTNQNTKSNSSNKVNSLNKSSFILPAIGPLGSGFGERVHPINGSMEMHKGVDIKANSGEPIKAALGGTVLEAGPNSTFGNLVKIDHQNGFITLYAHCSVIIVKKGQSVKKGDTIAKVGSTGSSTGPHLHFEIWKNEKPVNPLDYITLKK